MPPIYILIPAYNPDEKLITLLETLVPHQFSIVIVNDGSSGDYTAIFERAKQFPNVILLEHAVNQGKGVALKTGFHYMLAHPNEKLGVVTVDADGQHLVDDIVRVAETLKKKPQHLILGVRTFGAEVPRRSRFGNQLTRSLFRRIYKTDIQDTQTGLRGIPLNLLGKIVEFHSKHYEYELEYLIYAAKEKLPIDQVRIHTVYIDNNSSSHFNPFIDSLRIYYVFLRFAVISFFSFILDIGIFIVLHLMGFSLFSCVAASRIVSGCFNFYNNKYAVYKSRGREALKHEIIHYTVLAVVILLLSFILIYALHNLFGGSVILWKILVDGLLFLLSFVAQRKMIFRKKEVK